MQLVLVARHLGLAAMVRVQGPGSMKVMSDLSFELNAELLPANKIQNMSICLSISVNLCSSPHLQPKLKFFSWRGAGLAWNSLGRWIHFPNQSWVLSYEKNLNNFDSKKIQHIEIWTESAAFAVEKSFLYTLAIFGIELEKRGYLRLHAASFRSQERALAVFGPSGVGKTTLVDCLLNHSNCNVFSDEITLICKEFQNQHFVAWPLRLAKKISGSYAAASDERLRADGRLRRLMPIPPDRVAERSGTADKVGMIFFGVHKKHSEARILPLTFLRSLLFVLQVSFGWHLPQMFEISLRLSLVFHFAKEFFRRFAWAMKMLAMGRVQSLIIPIFSNDSEKDRAALAHLLILLHHDFDRKARG